MDKEENKDKPEDEKVTDKETENLQAGDRPDKPNSVAGSGTNPSGPPKPVETKSTSGPKRPPKKQGRKKKKDDDDK